MWVQLALLILQSALAFMRWVETQHDFTAGQDAERARMLAKSLASTQVARQIMDEVNALRGADIDLLLRSLESDTPYGQLLSDLPESDPESRRRLHPGA